MNAAMEVMLVMRMQTASTPKALTFVPVRRDILGPESHAKVHYQIIIRTLAHFRLLLLSDKASRPAFARHVRLALTSDRIIWQSHAYSRG